MLDTEAGETEETHPWKITENELTTQKEKVNVAFECFTFRHYDLWIICLRFVLSYLIVPGETCVFFLNCYSSLSNLQKLQFFKIHIIIISGVTIYIYKVCHERKIMFVIIYSILLCRHIEIYD